LSEIVKVAKINEVYLQIECDQGIAYELNEYFSFEAPGAKFNPKVRNKIWDGRIRLFSLLKRQLYIGLYLQLHHFCKERGYTIEKVETEYGKPLDIEDVNYDQVERFCSSLDIMDETGENIDPYDFQCDAVFRSIRYQRRLFLSPTASGKSLIIYLAIRALLHRHPEARVLIITPRVSLVEQLYTNFKEFSEKNGWDVEGKCARIHKEFSKEPTEQIVISTWQSVYDAKPSWFRQFDAVIGDEAHEYKAKSLIHIMESCTNAKWRIGMTGSLDGIPTNKLVLEGLFGPVHSLATTKELMDRGIVAQLKISCVVLKHKKEDIKAFKKTKMTYQEEIQYLITNEQRNQFIVKLAMAQTQNTLVLFQRVEKHGEKLVEIAKKIDPNRPIFYISGKTEIEVREQVRKITDKINNAVLFCSYGTFAMGVSMRNLHRIILGSPYKSRTKILQSIGRGLRLHPDKVFAKLYDIGDNLVTNENGKPNFSLDHMMQRIEIYDDQEFEYTIVEVPF
jgi:superfamily II DNA or RNA helicase